MSNTTYRLSRKLQYHEVWHGSTDLYSFHMEVDKNLDSEWIMDEFEVSIRYGKLHYKLIHKHKHINCIPYKEKSLFDYSYSPPEKKEPTEDNQIADDDIPF